MKVVDMSEQKFSFTFDSPVKLWIDPNTGRMALEGTPIYHGLGISQVPFLVELSREASQELFDQLKEAEQFFGTKGTLPKKPDSLQ